MTPLIIPLKLKSVVDHVEEGGADRDGASTSGSGILDKVVCVTECAAKMSNGSAILVKIVSGKGDILAANVENNGSITSDGRVDQYNTNGLNSG